MLVWILIAACWAGLLLLILHDATKDADGRSAVSVASRNTVLTAARGVRGLRRSRPLHKLRSAYAASRNTHPTPVAGPALEASPVEAPAQTSPATIPATETSKKNWWRRDHRAQITPAELELTITEAIKNAAPECSSFVGVIVHHKKPRQHRDSNWGVRGIKFGKADRRVVNETLTRIVEQLQREVRLTDPQLRN